MRATITALVATGLLLTAGAAAADPIAIFTYRSEPGDFIGQGQSETRVFREPADEIRVVAETRVGTAGPVGVRFNLLTDDSTRFVVAWFSTVALGTPLHVGEYGDAQRASDADPGHPGLDIGMDNRGANTLSGAFTISDIHFVQVNGLWNVTRFSASFEQHAEGLPTALFGTLDYNASPTPEPASLVLLLTGAAGLGTRYRFRRAA